MTSNLLFSVTTGIYITAFFLLLGASVFRQPRLVRPVVFLMAAGLGIQTFGFGKRVVEFSTLMQSLNPEPLHWTRLYQYFPVTNMYESLVLFAWTMVAIYLFLYFRRGMAEISWLVALLASITMAYASGLAAPQAAVAPLVPALKSNWLLFHVITCFLAYAAFGVSATFAVLALATSPSHRLDHLMYRVVLFGFLLLTVGIILGAVWANESWGSYWSWDPKETWSLITWFVYAAFLHARRTRGWTGRPAATVVLIGFAVTLFCYLGVNLVLSGLHSYGAK